MSNLSQIKENMNNIEYGKRKGSTKRKRQI